MNRGCRGGDERGRRAGCSASIPQAHCGGTHTGRWPLHHVSRHGLAESGEQNLPLKLQHDLHTFTGQIAYVRKKLVAVHHCKVIVLFRRCYGLHLGSFFMAGYLRGCQHCAKKHKD